MPALNNKVVVVTGSTRGFGYAIAEAALRAGAKVILSGRSEAALQRAIKTLAAAGQVTGQVCDVRKEAEVYALARFAIQKYGQIDVWINNAGYSAAAGMMIDLNPALALEMFEANDLGTLYGAQAALRQMLPRKDGLLVNIYGAGSFLNPSSPTGLYAATKAWITSFTRTLATELKGSGVKLLGFSPGMMLTDMLLNPTVVGERGREGLRRFGFVLRFLGKKPEVAAAELVRAIEHQNREFAELRLFKPWTPMLGLIRIGWENLTKTGREPEFTLHYEEPYRPEL